MLLANTPRALLVTVGSLFSACAFAQTADSARPVATAVTDQSTESITEIVVTGSRIARSDFEAPNPNVSFNAANIQQSGDTNITNFLARVPALTGSRDSTQTSGGGMALTAPSAKPA